jgi:hypothetical protein
MSSPVIVTYTSCHMYNIAFSVSGEDYTCDKCREIVRLTEKISELETHIQTLIDDTKNARALDTALDVTSLVNSLFGSGCRARAAGQSWDKTPLFRSDYNNKQVLPTQ